MSKDGRKAGHFDEDHRLIAGWVGFRTVAFEAEERAGAELSVVAGLFAGKFHAQRVAIKALGRFQIFEVYFKSSEPHDVWIAALWRMLAPAPPVLSFPTQFRAVRGRSAFCGPLQSVR
jgi:hypothetical protein